MQEYRVPSHSSDPPLALNQDGDPEFLPVGEIRRMNSLSEHFCGPGTMHDDL